MKLVADSAMDSLALHRWLRTKLRADTLSITNTKSPDAGGWSNETLIFDASVDARRIAAQAHARAAARAGGTGDVQRLRPR